MLHLAAETSPDWIERALTCLDEILLDHAHCERKAASTAMSMIFRYTEHALLMEPLSAIAREELEHFELMLRTLGERGVPWRRMKPSAYAGRLMKVVRPDEPDRLLDTLLCCAFIEARSCERMQILAEALPDAELAALYRSLLASEARHHRFYVDVAEQIFDRAEVASRLAVVAEHEAEVIRTAYPENRLHG